MTEQQPTTPTDYLTRLPQETLQYICELSIDPLHPVCLGLVSKAFLPFASHRVFAKVRLGQPAEFVKFARLVEASPGAGGYVKELQVVFVSGQQDDGNPSTKDFLKFLTHLPALVDLALVQSTRLVKAFLSDTKTRRLLPALKFLKLQDPFTGWANPFDPSHYYPLARHPDLRFFDLRVERTADSLGRYAPTVAVRKIKWKWRFGVELYGPLTDNRAAHELLLVFKQVHTLALYDTSTTSNVAPLLQHLPSSHVLSILSLNFPMPLSEASAAQIGRTLPFFTGLTDITFGQNSFHPSLLPALYALPNLSDIVFLYDCGVTAKDIVEFLSHSDKLTRLQDVVLSPLRRFLNCFGVDIDIHEPEWTVELSHEAAKDILVLCEERSINCTGVVGDYVKYERELEQHRVKGLAERGGEGQQTDQ